VAALEAIKTDRDDPWRGGPRLRLGPGQELSLDLLSRSIASIFGGF
jgi:hypothetical protein